MCLVFTNIFIKFFAVTANILHPRAVECAYARECQLWVNYYGQLREEHSEKNMCNNVQQCTFVYISEHFSFLNPLILAHRNAHRKTFFHIEKHFLKKTHFWTFLLCAFHVHFCTFLHIANPDLFENIVEHFSNTDLFENIVEHFSFRAPADVRGNVLKCFKQKTTFLHIFAHFKYTFLHLVLHHISSTLWFYSQQGLFFYVFYVHFPKNVFLCEKMFFYVHFRHNKNNKNNKKTATLTTKMY